MASRSQELFATRDVFVIALAALFSSGAWANPSGPVVVSGAAAFKQNGSSLTVTNSPNAIINWKNFSIQPNETTRFIQQSAASAVLNRVVGADPSQILGALQSNGRVFLVNPAGILVGQGARIDVAGLVASTLNISNEDFLAGRMRFQAENGAGNVVNQGEITTPNGGTVYLIASGIENSGIIRAPHGEVLLAAGQTVQLLNTETPDVAIEITGKPGNVTNIGRILADAGRIGLEGAVIRNEALISADSVVNDGGRIFLRASEVTNAGDIGADGTVGGGIEIRTGDRFTQTAGGTLHADSRDRGDGGRVSVVSDGTADISGRISAMGGVNGGDGGFIETSAAKVKIEDGAIITTAAPQGAAGTWLIDPTDFTIAASGGDMTGSQLSTNLGGGNVTIVSSSGGTAGSGDINVNDAVSWGANTLTLTAARDVNINSVMTPSGTSALALNTATTNGADSAVTGGTVNVGLTPSGFRGRVDFGARSGTGFLTINGNAYTVINSLGAQGSTTGTDLQGMNGNLFGYYALGGNVDATTTLGWNAGAGFLPVGNLTTGFSGTFDGLGHTITGLTINIPSTGYVGLFGYANNISGAIRNVGLVGGSITGNSVVGGLAGSIWGAITNSYATGSATGTTYTGGLVGENAGIITNSYATGSVSGTNYVGGLAGYSHNSTITNSYATGSVTGSIAVGGLAGENWSCTITNSYATGGVTGSRLVGGLVGYNTNAGTISNSYATGSVTNTGWYTGGLVGYNDISSTITNSYSTGMVSGATFVGGLVGSNGGTVDATNFWDTITSTQTAGVGSNGAIFSASGLTTAQMQTMSSFSGWSIANTGGSNAVWRIYEGNTYPLLKSFLTPLTVTANAASKTYDGLAYSGGNGVTYSITPNVNLLGTVSYGGTSQGATNAGSYVITPGGYYSNQQGYDVSYVDGTLTINPASLNLLGITANNASKTYGATLTFNGTEFTPVGLLGGDIISGVTLTSAGAVNTANAGTYAIIPSAAVFSVGTASNYTITYTNGALTVTPAPLAITANNASKTYDGAAYSGGNGVAYSGFVNSETTAVLGGALVYGGTAQGAINAGSYTIVPSGLTSGNYALSFVNGSLSITSAVPPSPPPPSSVVPAVVTDVAPAAAAATAVANTVLADTVKTVEGVKTIQQPYEITPVVDALNSFFDVQVPPQSAINIATGVGGAKTPLDVCGPSP